MTRLTALAQFVLVAAALWLVQALPPTLVAVATGDATYGGPLALATILLRTPSWILACLSFAGTWVGGAGWRRGPRALAAGLAYLVVGVVLDGLVWGFTPDFVPAEATWVALRGGQAWAGVAVAALLAATSRPALTRRGR